MSVTKFSGCIIARDEEQYIERAILNMKPYVDEIVVVDSGSVDNTVSICESHGCKVFYRQFEFHYADQRNYALDMCSNDWVLILDADEYFSENTLSNIHMFINIGNSKKISSFGFKITHYFDDKPAEVSHNVVRLVNKRNGSWVGRLHEVFTPVEGFRELKAPPEFEIFHKKTLSRQIYNTLLYSNLEKEIFERPPYDMGALVIDPATNEIEIVKNDRNKL